MFCICVTINHIDVCSLAGVFKIVGSFNDLKWYTKFRSNWLLPFNYDKTTTLYKFKQLLLFIFFFTVDTGVYFVKDLSMLFCWFNHEKLFLYGGLREVSTRSVAHFNLFPYLFLVFQIRYPQLIKLQKCVELKCRIFKFTVAIRFKSYNILNFTLHCQNRKCFFWIIADFVICESISGRLQFHKQFSCHIIL
jgi:hypothetical protein